MNVGPGEEDRPTDQADLSRRDFLRRGAAPVVAFIALEAIGGLGLATGTAPKETKLSTGVIFPDCIRSARNVMSCLLNCEM